ncbi:hypothetical protein [Methylotenera sp.]|uniref:hypothetical protein n=1 Tax=Methylotenera sp. TaxID=2051956 RepID=UPI002489B93C|nr:hypothetical protein [Methylotenera sp.]MDI1360636.1 hypothetical protein [Methylotenera sp.]
MALVKKPAVVAETTVGQFEEVEGEQTVETVAEQAAPSAADKVKVEATVAIAKAQNTAVGAVAPKFQTVLSEFENALPIIDFGVIPRLKGSNGQIMDGDNASLGNNVQITLVSFNDQFVLTPGEDSDEATKLVRYSSDGVTIDATGQSVAEYINYLVVTEGYKDASVKHYLEVIGILNTAAEGQKHLGDMVQLSLSPQSRKAFDGYRIQRSVKVRMGKVPADGSEEITFRAKVKTMGKFTFTVLEASDK